MSAVFTQFLREQAAKRAGEAERARAVVDEWRAAIEALYGQFRAWLAESDPDRVVRVEQRDQEVKENGLGQYSVPRLDLRIFDKWIGIIPKARKTVAVAPPRPQSAPERATGRIDITY